MVEGDRGARQGMYEAIQREFLTTAPFAVMFQKIEQNGANEAIEFYGMAHQSLYTDTNFYTLRVDPSATKRIDEDRTPPSRFGTTTTVYRETTRIENDRKYSFASPNGDPWYDFWISAIYKPTSAELSLMVDGYVPEAGPVVLDLELWGVTNWPDRPDHHTIVSVNDNVVADLLFDGTEIPTLSVEIPADGLLEGGNEVRIDLPLDLGVAFDLVALESYAITYPRQLIARDGHLTFKGEAADSFSVSGLPSEDAVVYRISQEKVERLSRYEVSGEPGDHTVTFAGSSNPGTYLVATAATGLTPGIQPAPAQDDIFSGDASYLVIAHPDFLGGGLDPLIARREAQGFSVQVVDLDQIYENLSNGIVDPGAIQEFISSASRQCGTTAIDKTAAAMSRSA